MRCPHCGSSTVRRSRRRGLRDQLASWINRWPYRCEACYLRFWADRRWPSAPQPAQARPQSAGAPTATIKVQAASPAQLDEMLLSLNEALSRFQGAPRRDSFQAASRTEATVETVR